MDRRRLWALLRTIWITLGLSATAVFTVWSLVAYRASGAARAAAVSDDAVQVRERDGVWRFAPVGGANPAGVALVFFPGALVDPLAYAPLLHAVAADGHAAYLVELPRRGAFGGAEDPRLWERLARVRGEVPARWIVAGHSRGGVVASRVAADGAPGLSGLVLVGTSHPRDVDLAAVAFPVTKVVGTRDGLASPAEVEANRRLLPPSTRWVWVDGGNHSQFGWYGFQPGDRRARIPAAEQRALMVRAVLDALDAAPATAPSAPGA